MLHKYVIIICVIMSFSFVQDHTFNKHKIQFIYEIDFTEAIPNDTYFSRQWGVYNDGSFSNAGKPGADIGLLQAWDIEKGDSTIILAILDSGVRLEHSELHNRIWKNLLEIPDNGIDDDNNGYVDDIQGWDFINNDNDPSDDRGHGTRVAGIIGANPNNNIGYAGIDWHCKLMVIKVTDKDGATTTDILAQAINYAVANGAKVINMSLAGAGIQSVPLETAVKNAYQNNAVMIAGSGNTGDNTVNYPAGYPEVIAVGATNAQDKLYSYSTYGSFLDVVAPGVKIYTLDHHKMNYFDGEYTGTSYATPYVSGVVSLLLAQNISRTPDEIKNIINATADDTVGPANQDAIGWDKYFGHGRINAYKALSYQTTSLATHLINDHLINIYPNILTSYNDKITIEIDESVNIYTLPVNIKIYNSAGVNFENIEYVGERRIEINNSELSKGYYIFSITVNSNIINKKVVCL